MDLPVGSVSGVPREVPMPWAGRFSCENRRNPGIETWRIAPLQDFDLILNRPVGHSAISENRCESSSTYFVFKEHELSCVSLAGQIAEVENPGSTFVLGIRARNVVKIIRHQEWNRKAVLNIV